MKTRGDLDGAEGMYRKALAIDEKLGHLEGMAIQYGNLGIVMKTRGDLDGAEAITRIELALGKAVPSIVLTGESALGEVHEMSEVGYLILRKPVRPGKLRSLINHFLSQPDAIPKPHREMV